MSARLSCPPAPEPLASVCGAVRLFFPDVGSAPWFSHVSVGLAAAARSVQDTDGACRHRALGSKAQVAEVQRLQFFLSEAPPGMPKRSMPGAWRCRPLNRPLLRYPKGC